jgi:Protein of unknown function (DUF1573)
MKRPLLAWLTLLIGAAAAPAQGWANKLFKDQHTHDFGTVPRGAQLFHRFTLTNIYAVPLEITEIRSSCGCVSATAATRVVQPRGTTTIDVSMDGRRFSGPKTVVLYVTVGPKFVSTAELRVTANSRADVVFNPGQVSFGLVAPGQTPSQTVDVEYAGSLDWRVTEVLTSGAPFDAELKELYRQPGQRVGYQVKVTLKSDVPSGVLKREMHLRTNDPASPLISVLVEANVQTMLSVVPGVLRFGQVRPGETLLRKVIVQGKTPFRVVGVDGLGDGLVLGAEPSPSAAAVQTLTFKLTPAQPGELRRQLTIRTDLQGGSVALAVEGTVAP